MLASRTASRAAARTIRAPIRQQARQTRFVSTTQAEGAKAGGASGFAAGIAGGAVVLAVSISFLPAISIHLPLNTILTLYPRDATHTTNFPVPKPSSMLTLLRNLNSKRLPQHCLKKLPNQIKRSNGSAMPLLLMPPLSLVHNHSLIVHLTILRKYKRNMARKLMRLLAEPILN